MSEPYLGLTHHKGIPRNLRAPGTLVVGKLWSRATKRSSPQTLCSSPCKKTCNLVSEFVFYKPFNCRKNKNCSKDLDKLRVNYDHFLYWLVLDGALNARDLLNKGSFVLKNYLE